jgi:hypothetical protein
VFGIQWIIFLNFCTFLRAAYNFLFPPLRCAPRAYLFFSLLLAYAPQRANLPFSRCCIAERSVLRTLIRRGEMARRRPLPFDNPRKNPCAYGKIQRPVFLAQYSGAAA